MKKTVERTCQQCGKQFFDRIRNDRTVRFCSHPCYAKSKEVNSLPVKVDKKTGCWNWLRAISPSGYGRLKVKQHMYRAHRYFYEREYGKIPEGKVIDHLRRNKKCVNPKHLEVVTVAINTRRGNATKLSESIISRIIGLYRSNKLTQVQLGYKFGVDQSTISDIVCRRSWI